MKTSIIAAVALLTLCTFTRAEGEPEVIQIDPIAIIKGSCGEGRGSSGLFVDAESLEHLWETWTIDEKMPEVDFTRQFVVTSTWVGSRQDVSWGLFSYGRFFFSGGGTKDIKPGFRYTIGVFSREGVRNVNGVAVSIAKEDAAGKD